MNLPVELRAVPLRLVGLDVPELELVIGRHRLEDVAAPVPVDVRDLDLSAHLGELLVRAAVVRRGVNVERPVLGRRRQSFAVVDE